MLLNSSTRPPIPEPEFGSLKGPASPVTYQPSFFFFTSSAPSLFFSSISKGNFFEDDGEGDDEDGDEDGDEDEDDEEDDDEDEDDDDLDDDFDDDDDDDFEDDED